MMRQYVIAIAAVTLISLGLVACSHSRRGTLRVDERNDDGTTNELELRIDEQPATALWKVYNFYGSSGKPMKQLVVDGNITLRESDSNRDGEVDKVRIRLSDGSYIVIADTNFDGHFDSIDEVIRKGVVKER